jgi:hypothetical protein
LAQAIFEEIVASGLHLEGWATTQPICDVLLRIGTEEQKTTFLRGALSGDIVIVLGYTEPDCGSDVAAVKTRAVRDGDEWVINGQKMFTSGAHSASHVFLLTRSNLDAPKHKGLTTFIVSLRDEAIRIEPIPTVGGQRTNTTFYNEARVPDSARIGEVDGGWSVMRIALAHERRVPPGGTKESIVEMVATWAQNERRIDGTAIFEDGTVRQRLARAAVVTEVSRLLTLRAAWVHESDAPPGVEAPIAKLFRSEQDQVVHSDMLDVVGAESILQRDAAGPLGGSIEEGFRSGIVSTIFGGTSEIMREIISEQGLGLPRTRG